MKNLYCIVDTVNKEWGPIVILNNDEVAKRMFRNETEKVSSDILSSLVLYKIGTYNPEFRIQNEVLTPICSDTFGTFIISGKDILNEDVKEIVDES